MRVKYTQMKEWLLYYEEEHLSARDTNKSTHAHIVAINRLLGDKWVHKITPTDIENFRHTRQKEISSITKRNITVSTVNREHTILTNFFYKMEEWRDSKQIPYVKLPHRNPASQVKKYNEESRARKRVVSPSELSYMLRYCTKRVKLIVLLAVLTTLRRKDLQLLTRDNIDDSTSQLRGTQSKTGKPYSIPISSQIRSILDSHSHHYVCDFTNFRREFEGAIRQSGIPRFQLRDLRRTGARAMLTRGVDYDTVRKFLGHTKITMTQIYVPPSNKDVQDAGAKLSNFFEAVA